MGVKGVVLCGAFYKLPLFVIFYFITGPGRPNAKTVTLLIVGGVSTNQNTPNRIPVMTVGRFFPAILISPRWRSLTRNRMDAVNGP
jgi:hypothetical protein